MWHVPCVSLLHNSTNIIIGSFHLCFVSPFCLACVFVAASLSSSFAFFFHPPTSLWATVSLPCDSPLNPVVVSLISCGSAFVRVVKRSGGEHLLTARATVKRKWSEYGIKKIVYSQVTVCVCVLPLLSSQEQPKIIEPLDYEAVVFQRKAQIHSDPHRDLLLCPVDDVSVSLPVPLYTFLSSTHKAKNYFVINKTLNKNNIQ